MRSETRLDFAIFQLTPTRTRCELLVSAGGVKEKLASGLLKPFLAHLKAAEEEIDRGGYSIKLVPFFADSPNTDGAAWFTKGTIERFVRFVSTPEVLERVSSVESELVQIEEAISIQANDARVDEQYLRTPSTPPQGGFVLQGFSMEKGFSAKSRRNSIDGADVTGGDSSKWRLLRAMDARRLMLQKEQGMAFARAAAAGFDREHMEDLVAFADCFGAMRLREACVKFMALCKKRQQAGIWVEEMELAAAEAAAIRPEGGLLNPGAEFGSFIRGRDYSDAWSDAHSEGGDDSRDDVSMRLPNNFYRDGRSLAADDDLKRRRGPQEDSPGDGPGEYAPQRLRRYSSGPAGLVPPSIDELQATAYSHEILGRPYGASPGVYPGGRASLDSHQGEHMSAYDYRDSERTHGHPVPSNRSPGYVPGYHSPSTSPGQRAPTWIQGGEEEQGYDPRGQYGPAYSVGRSPHGAGPYVVHNHYNNPPPHHHSAYTDNAGNLQWRQGEKHPVWAPAQPPSQYWQGNVGQNDNSGPDLRGPQQGTVPNSQSQELHSNGSQGFTREVQMQRDNQSSEQGVIQGFSSHGDQMEGYSKSTATPVHREGSLMGSEMLTQTANKDDKVLMQSPVGDQDAKSPAEKLSLSPMEAANRRLARRSTSPRRRSSSPLRKVQVGRSGSRRSGLVVIRNINYITSSQEKAAQSKEKGSDDDSEGNESGDEEDNSKQKKSDAPFSVKDAITLFEKKRRESGDSAGKKLSRADSHRGSSESGGSSFNDRGSAMFNDRIKRWSSTGADHSNDTTKESWTVDQVKNLSAIDADGQEVDSGPSRHVQQEVHHEEEGEVVEVDVGRKYQSQDVDISGLPYRQHSASRALPQFESESFVNPQSNIRQMGTLSGEEMVLPFRDSIDDGKKARSALQFLPSELKGAATQKESGIDDSFILPERIQRGAERKVRGNWADNQDMTAPMMDEASKEALLDDSFIVPTRGVVQQKTAGALGMELEMPFDEQISGTDGKDVESSQMFSAEDLMDMPDRNVGRESLGRRWSTADYDMEFMGNGVDSGYQEDEDQTVVGDSEAPGEQQGRFYEQYREKREAKLRDEPGSKRAEREAKLKAMQEVFERRKAEMGTRSTKSAEKYTCSADAQLRAEKLRAFKAGLLKTKKEKEEEERKRIDDLRTQRRDRIAARGSPTGTQSAASTPRAVRQTPSTPKSNSLQRLSPSKNAKATAATSRALISSSPKASSGRLSSVGVSSTQRSSKNTSNQVNSENPLARSVPSMVDLRKENTKPSVGRSTLNDKVGGSGRIQSKIASSMHRSKSANDASPLEANGGIPVRSVARATISDEKKRRSSFSTRKSIAVASELKASGTPPGTESTSAPLKVSKELPVEPPVKIGKKANGVEAKPFLRKGTGIGPGTGPVRKLKASQVSDTPRSLDEDAVQPALQQDSCEGDLGLRENVELKSEDDVLPGTSDSLAVPNQGSSIEVTQGDEHQITDKTEIGPDSHSSNFRGQAASGSAQSPEPLLEPDSVILSSEKHSLLEKDAGTSSDWKGLAPDVATFSGVSKEAELYGASASEVLNLPTAMSTPSKDFVKVDPHTLPHPSPMQSPSGAIPACSPEEYKAPPTHASPSPSHTTVAPNIEDYEFILASPSDTIVPENAGPPQNVVSLSPAASQSFPKLQRSVSPAANKGDASKSRKKWGGSQKSASSSAQQNSKEAPKGFKRLLHFGRRSRTSSTTSTTEWVSASTASEGDEDVEESKLRGTSSGEIMSKMPDLNSSSSKARSSVNGKSNNLRYMGDSPDSSSRTSDASGSGDRGSGSRSFFSLSSFRSKADSKYRA